jgi:hypothetical protein
LLTYQTGVSNMPARALITFGIAQGDADLEPLSVSSREMLQCERQWKGFTAQDFFATVSITNLYKVGFVVLRMRGDERIRKGLTFDEFVDEWSVSLGDPTPTSPTDDGFIDLDPESEATGEATPTEPAA